MAKSNYNGEYDKLITGLAVIGIAYFGVLRPILTKLGIQKSEEERQQDQLQQNAIEATTKEVLNKQKPTIADAQLKFYADTIYQALRYSSANVFDIGPKDDYEKAGLYLSTPKNEADVYRLIQLFGTREECYFGVLCYSRSLPQMVQSNLSKEKIAAINDNYKRKGIKFRW